jgi:histidinol-phosphate aminotransferase
MEGLGPMKYARVMLGDVEGYVPGEQPKAADVVKLNTNENPYAPSPTVLEALFAFGPDALRVYPDPVALKLRAACAKLYGYPGEEWVVAGNGMDEILALALRTFVDPGDAVLTPYPTYSLYEVLAKLHGAVYVEDDLDESNQLSDSFFEREARLCLLPRPNAPTGVASPTEEVERLCAEFDGIVLIDEAYVDFAEDSCVDFPKRFDNVIVARTFSKSYSLAGIRLGAAVANPDLIAEFLKTKDSYNLNAFTQAAGIAALEDRDHFDATVRKVKATRARLTGELRGLGFAVRDSQANFVLARWQGRPGAEGIFEALRGRNILVRYFKARGLDDCLRISVGTDGETDALLDALREIVL